MNEKNTQALIEACPKIFNKTHPETAFRLFSFECGDGWFELLKELLEQINEIVQFLELCEDEYFPISVAQVKEKYGTLRFYMYGTTDSIEQVIDKAELKSAITCEECGKPGSMRERHHWYSVRCDECWKQNCERYP